jgi:hypothetical protein
LSHARQSKALTGNLKTTESLKSEPSAFWTQEQRVPYLWREAPKVAIALGATLLTRPI